MLSAALYLNQIRDMWENQIRKALIYIDKNEIENNHGADFFCVDVLDCYV